MKLDFNINILNSLLSQYPDRANNAFIKFPKLNKWIEEEDKPTLKQLVDISNFFKIPFGYFFLNEIPEKLYPIPHYRTIEDQIFQPSSELMDTIFTLKQRQEWAEDLLKELRTDKLPFAGSITTSTPIETAVKQVNAILGLPVNWAAQTGSWTDAFHTLIEKAELAGIFVVLNGIVNLNTKRKLNVDEFRGFVLYNEYAPFVFINNNDAISAKIFTLIHEIAHILIGKSASFDLRQLQPASDDTEKYCNQVSAEFLVPAKKLTISIEQTGTDYKELARIFKVSQIVIARRLLDLDMIKRNDFFAFYNEYISKELKSKEQKGGNFYNTAPYRISRRFFQLIYSSVKQNKILYRDAFKLTGLTPKTFDEYIIKNLR